MHFKILITLLSIIFLPIFLQAQIDGKFALGFESGLSNIRLKSPVANSSDLLFNYSLRCGYRSSLSSYTTLSNSLVVGRTGYALRIGTSNLTTGSNSFNSRVTTLQVGLESYLEHDLKATGNLVGGGASLRLLFNDEWTTFGPQGDRVVMSNDPLTPIDLAYAIGYARTFQISRKSIYIGLRYQGGLKSLATQSEYKLILNRYFLVFSSNISS